MNKKQVYFQIGCFCFIRKIIKIFPVIFFLLMSKSVLAQNCRASVNPSELNFNFSSLVINNSNVAAGTVLATRSMTSTSESNYARYGAGCAFAQSIIFGEQWNTIVEGVKADGFPNAYVYETGIPGIGYIVRVKNTAPMTEDVPWVDMTTFHIKAIWGENIRRAVAYFDFLVEIRLVATGQPIQSPTTSLNLQVGRVGAINGQGDWSSTTNTILKIIISAVDVVETTCSVQGSKNLALTLPTVHVPDLNAWAIGADQGTVESNTGVINLRCPANVAAYGTFVDAGNKSNTSNVLSTATAGDSAKGVGIILLSRNTASGPWNRVSYGPESSSIGGRNQMLIAAATTQEKIVNIYVKAKYTKTGDVTAGSVAGKSLLVFAYP